MDIIIQQRISSHDRLNRSKQVSSAIVSFLLQGITLSLIEINGYPVNMATSLFRPLILARAKAQSVIFSFKEPL